MKDKEQIIYLELEQVLLIHSMVVDETGGLHGIRDMGALEGAIALPRQFAFGHELHSGVFRKAAAYALGIIMSHAFLDGNKRTGMSSAAIFLENNDYVLHAKEGELADFAVKIVESELGHEEIESWFQERCRKIETT